MLNDYSGNHRDNYHNIKCHVLNWRQKLLYVENDLGLLNGIYNE